MEEIEFHNNLNITNHPRVPLSEAILKNYSYYWTGKPCPHGHLTFRYVINYNCVRCSKERIARLKYKKHAQSENDKQLLASQLKARRLAIEDHQHKNHEDDLLDDLWSE